MQSVAPRVVNNSKHAPKSPVSNRKRPHGAVPARRRAPFPTWAVTLKCVSRAGATTMTRDAVEALLRTRHRWRIYCEGGKQLPEDGSGHTLPAGILREVPTPA
jgi:hypothetical protein